MENQTLNISLDVNSINFLLQALGELPTKTGAWNLLTTIKQQAEAQMPPVVEYEVEEDEVAG